jgi:hypothetical protein
MAAEEGQVISVHTVESWKEQIQKGNDSKKLVQFKYLRIFFIYTLIVYMSMISIPLSTYY